MKNNDPLYVFKLGDTREQLPVLEVIQIYRRLKWHYLREWRSELTNKQVWFKVLWAFYEDFDPANFARLEDTLRLIDSLPHSGKVTGGARMLLYKKLNFN